MTPLGTFTFPGPVGRLEALYRPGDGNVDDMGQLRAAVICHPHPLHGGTMHTKVAYRTAKAFQSLGYPTLRFNFRGVGASQGDFADGIGEADDVRAALNWMASEHPELPLVLAGFSFGSVVGLPVGAADPRVTHLVGLGVPADRFRFALLDVDKPKLFVQGDRDEFGPAERLRENLRLVAEPWQLVVVEDSDHFFSGKLDAMQEAVEGYFGDAAADSSAAIAST